MKNVLILLHGQKNAYLENDPDVNILLPEHLAFQSGENRV